MRTKPVSVTPAMAKEWLKKNVCNRPISKTTVKRYAEAMLAGEWKINGDSIRFDEKGRLIDGQHRLLACIEANKSFKTYVITDLPQDAFDTIDQGKPRTIADVLARRGEKNYTVLAAAVRYMIFLEQSNPTSRAGKIRPSMVDSVLIRHPQIRKSVQAAKAIERKTTVISTSQLAALHYLFSREDKDRNDVFWERVAEGVGIRRNMPEMVLRQRLLKNSVSQAKLSETAIFAICIKTWNCITLNKPLKMLQWQQEKENFPKLVKALKVVSA